jgi:hypothetical protein
MQIEGEPINRFAEDNYVMLIVMNNWLGSDIYQDSNIEKSGKYTILPGTITMSFNGMGVIRYASGIANSLQFFAVMVPNAISPNQITKLADIKILGGHILASTGEGVIGAMPSTISQPKVSK